MKKVDSAERTAVLVLGMHRSGTSAVTRTLNMLGADIGDNLVPPGYDNPMGFWEHAEVVRINENLLKGLGRTWYDMREMPQGWTDSEPGREAFRDAVRLIHDSFGSSCLCAVKDPRMCLTARVWVDAFRAEQFNVACLFVVRHPSEVVDSLHRRNEWPRASLYLMWVQYLLEAVVRTQDCPRAMVTYDQMLTDWRAAVSRIAADLHLTWTVGIDEVASEVDKFLDSRQRHHKHAPIGKGGTPKDLSLPALVGKLYKECLVLAGGKGDWNSITDEHEDFRKVAELYTVNVDRLLTERWEAEERAETAESRLAEQASVAATVHEDVAQSREAIEAKLGLIEQGLAGHAHDVQTSNAALAAQVAEQSAITKTLYQGLHQSREVVEARLGRVEKNVMDSVQRELSQAREELAVQSDELRGRIEQHQEALHATEARVQRHNALLNTALLRLEQMAGDHALLDAQGNKLDVQGSKLDAIDSMLRTELPALRRARERSDAQLTEMRASTSWRLTKPLRWLSVHLLRRPPTDV